MRVLWIAALIATLMPPIATSAQEWPSRPVRLVVPFAPGGATDALARIVAARLAEGFGSTVAVVVENRPGAGGTLAADYVTRAAPDGHTILVGDIGPNAIAGSLYPNLPYDPVRSFAHVTQVVALPLVLLVHPSLPIDSVAGLVTLARNQPGRLNYGSTGPGGSAHLFMALFDQLSGVTTTHVPYRGGAPSLAALLTGEVQLLMVSVPTALPQVQAGTVRAIGTAAAGGSSRMPDLVPIARSVPGYDATSWAGLHVPAATPPSVVSAIHARVAAVLAEPATRHRLEQRGYEVVGSTPEAFTAFVAAETARWGELVRRSGARPE